MAELSKSRKRSSKRIKEAFLELLEKSRFENITVENIINTAEYSRTTFYAIFPDKFSLVEAIIDDLIDQYFATLTGDITKWQQTEGFKPYYEQIDMDFFKNVYEKKTFYKLIFNPEYPEFLRYYNNTILATTREYFSFVDMYNDPEVDILFLHKLTLRTYNDCIKLWIADDFKKPYQWMAKNHSAYMNHGLTSLLKIK